VRDGCPRPAAPALDADQLGAVAQIFAVLADPSRLRILQVLRRGEAIVSTIVEELGMKQPNVSKHLGVLAQAGLLSRRRDGNEIYYAIRDPIVFSLCSVACRNARPAALKSAPLPAARPLDFQRRSNSVPTR
jgi:DNA-binding transcriptional ArsR family regulator